ncbi:MAG TPA: glycoside hydrolase family 3 C-terminal domain-containing protein, partial [Bacteroidales bacterium]|nr:glycoside hydrolase family 3 C-terminal domain-containing protein [Bacteroidales bacterium]
MRRYSRWWLMMAILFGKGVMAVPAPDTLAFRNPALPLSERINDLISRLKPEEKAAQLSNPSDTIQRLGVMGYQYWNEALHGVVAPAMSSFPQAIALSATWDTALVRRVASAISDEARARNIRDGAGLTYWSPVINMLRDPRWGRSEETYGEDPLLTAGIASSFIRGMQGSDPKYLKTVATVKHFACNNIESGRHRISSDVDQRSLREYYLPAFKTCIREAGVASLMCAYNAVNGVPSPVNRTLLTHILREEWGFNGFVVSDCDAVSDVCFGHEYVLGLPAATALSVKSGTDLNCGLTYARFADSAMNLGILRQDEIDTALARVFRARFLLGEFDPPQMVPYASIPVSEIDCQEHRELALEAARKAIVLLKNEQEILPLNPDSLTKIAVLGPNENRVQLGGYSGFSTVQSTPLQGILDKFHGPGRDVRATMGCEILGPADSAEFNHALELARWADVVVLVCGTNPQVALEDLDRSELGLPGAQDSLAHAVFLANPKTIAVMVAGFPLAINRINEEFPAVLTAFYDGQAQGAAIADVLFGDCNPGGKLTSTWYRSVADLPPMDHYDIKENRTYQYFEGDPLYPFGYGLSYTTFAYSGLSCSKTRLGAGDSLTVRVAVANTGSVAGDEVVQCYVRHMDPPVTRPLTIVLQNPWETT